MVGKVEAVIWPSLLSLVKSRLTPSTVVVLDDDHGFTAKVGSRRSRNLSRRGLSYRYSAFNRKAVVIEDVRPATAEFSSFERSEERS